MENLIMLINDRIKDLTTLLNQQRDKLKNGDTLFNVTSTAVGIDILKAKIEELTKVIKWIEIMYEGDK